MEKKSDYLCVIKNEVKIYQLKIPYSGRFFGQTKYQARASVKDSGISVFFRGGGGGKKTSYHRHIGVSVG